MGDRGMMHTQMSSWREWVARTLPQIDKQGHRVLPPIPHPVTLLSTEGAEGKRILLAAAAVGP